MYLAVESPHCFNSLVASWKRPPAQSSCVFNKGLSRASYLESSLLFEVWIEDSAKTCEQCKYLTIPKWSEACFGGWWRQSLLWPPCPFPRAEVRCAELRTIESLREVGPAFRYHYKHCSFFYSRTVLENVAMVPRDLSRNLTVFLLVARELAVSPFFPFFFLLEVLI